MPYVLNTSSLKVLVPLLPTPSTVENATFDSASSKVAWFIEFLYCCLCESLNLTWGWVSEDIFDCVVLFWSLILRLSTVIFYRHAHKIKKGVAYLTISLKVDTVFNSVCITNRETSTRYSIVTWQSRLKKTMWK